MVRSGSSQDSCRFPATASDSGRRAGWPVWMSGRRGSPHNELQSIHEDAVEATLRQQWDALDDEDARSLLLVAGQLPEAAVIPNERLGLLAGVAVRSDDGEGPSSLDEALRRLEDDCLVEELRRDQVRLHPLVREFAERLTPAETRDAFRLTCAGRMAASLRGLRDPRGDGPEAPRV